MSVRQAKRMAKKRLRRKIMLICFIGIVLLCAFAGFIVTMDMHNVSQDFMMQKYDSSIHDNSSKLNFAKAYDVQKQKQEGEDRNPSGGSQGGMPGVDGITGNWKEDNIAGFKVAWTYLSATYEGGTLNPSTLQGHYNCTCKTGTPNVPSTYDKATVAHGAFQADSKYGLESFLRTMVSYGYTKFEPFILPADSPEYIGFESRNNIHQVFVEYENENFVQLLASEMSAMGWEYLKEEGVVALENAIGKKRDEIPDVIFSAMYSINIMTGSGTCTNCVKNFNSSMSYEQMINSLYDYAVSKKSSTANRTGADGNERKAALMWLNNPDFNGYEDNDIPGKGVVSFGKQMKLPGY